MATTRNTSSAMRLAKALGCLLVAMCISLFGFTGAYAAEGDQTQARQAYTFTITLLAGAQGDLTQQGLSVESNGAEVEYGTDRIVISNLAFGDRVSFSNDVATTKQDSKYYVKGVRMGGRDNSEAANLSPSISVMEDRDYVIAYGMKGTMVPYTVRFLDTDGNALLDERTYYGNVGDNPVVAYVYIAGYSPQAYNITGTLTEDPEHNVFEFVYTKLAPGQVVGEDTVTTQYVDIPGQTTYVTVPGETTTTTTTTPTAQTPVVAPAPTATEQLIADDGTPLATPQDVVNIDDNANPLASAQPKSQASNGSGAHPAFTEDGNSFIIWPTVVSVILLLGGIALLSLWFFKWRKSYNDQDPFDPTPYIA